MGLKPDDRETDESCVVITTMNPVMMSTRLIVTKI